MQSMIKQRKVIANPKGKNVSEVLGLDEKRSQALVDFTRKTFHKEKSYTHAMEICRKEAKTQEEFIWMVHNLGFEKGRLSGEERAARIAAHEMTHGIIKELFFNKPNKNDSFWGALDAIFIIFLFVALAMAIGNFPHNWWLIPLDTFLIALTFWRRIKL